MGLMKNPKKKHLNTRSLIKWAKIYRGKFLLISSDRNLIRRNMSENRKILARIDNLQIKNNHDVKSRVCAESSARINVDYISGF